VRFFDQRAGADAGAMLMAMGGSTEQGPAESDQRPGAVRFLLLGSFEVWRDGQRLRVGSRPHRLVLAALLLQRGQAVSTSRLISVVWGEDPPPTAAHQIHKIVAHLRQLLEPPKGLLLTEGSDYRIEVGPDQLDLDSFERQLARARAAGRNCMEAIAALWAAEELWRGPALSGLDSEALQTAAVVLDDRRLTAIEQLAALSTAPEHAVDLVGKLTALVAEHPLREALRGQLIRALYRVGRQADALAAYEAGRKVLSDELGVDPGAELARLQEQILRADPLLLQPPIEATAPGPAAPPPRPTGPESGPVGPVHAALPYDIPDFTGRRAELSALSTIIPEASQQALTIVTIDGMAGVGKTTLAIHAAHRLASRFPDGQVFLDLMGFTEDQDPMSPADALDRLLQGIGVPASLIPPTVEARSALWRSKLARLSVVLLLDNAVSSSQVKPLVPAGPGCVVLVTSRAKLTGLDGAVPVSLAPPSHSEALTIMQAVVGADRVAAERAELDELVKICGHLPLALRITAARMQQRPLWTVAHMNQRLRDADDGIGEMTDDGRSVQAAFRLTYVALDPQSQRLFRLLGTLPVQEIDVCTASAVTGLPVPVAETVHEELLDARLLEQRSANSYRFHDLLRSYASARAKQEESSQERSQVLNRFYEYLSVAVRRCATVLQPGWVPPAFEPGFVPVDPDCLPQPVDTDGALGWLDAEWDNILSAVRAAPRLGLGGYVSYLGEDLTYYLQLRGRAANQAEVLELAIDVAKHRGDRRAELRSRVNLFAPLWLSGRVAEAHRCADDALVLARQLNDRTREGVCLDNIGTVLTNQGHYAAALAMHEQALEIHRAAGNIRQQSAVFTNIGQVHDALARHDQALAAAESALAAIRSIGTESREVIPMINIGVAQAHLGRAEAAIDTLATASAAASRIGMPRGVAAAELALADVLRRLGRIDEAADRAATASRQLDQLDTPAITAELHHVVGDIHDARGEWSQAAAQHQIALDQARALGDHRQIVAALRGLGAARLHCGDVPAAETLLQEALSLAERSDMPQAGQIRTDLAAIIR
jgi:DNA-binding SARP family transcriptional activator/tetratricopeptide (TPR) repeat protein